MIDHARAVESGDGSIEELLGVLAAPRRRVVLAHVTERRAASLDELAAIVRSEERLGGRSSLDDEPTLRLLSEIRSVHVPALIDANLVEYDVEREVVIPTVTADLLFTCLEQVADDGHRGD
ncbi:hypothetical protein ACFQPA_18235 [Halomarina halobia]|uniref:DUF7344 domain-containing protein n=1 Tax=Halomarina halobia TaxID=3033386 RepID=A0ABD6AF58_9EURY|nr:hypothetical protein [Halomarina sp. PSR21]